MKESVREKLGVSQMDFVFLCVAGLILSLVVIVGFIPVISANPVLSVVALGFVLTLGCSVHLLQKYLEIRKLEAEPSAEELLKQKYVEDENLSINDYGDEYEKLKQIEEES